MALPHSPEAAWQTARGSVSLDRPVLVGILNVTPDSFSDGGQYTGLSAALAHAEELLGAGAYDHRCRRGVHPAGTHRGCARRRGAAPRGSGDRGTGARAYPELIISIDTVKASVAQAALDAGAAVVNDVSALRLDPQPWRRRWRPRGPASF